jgi:flagellar hook-associated protein 3 FlgL
MRLHNATGGNSTFAVQMRALEGARKSLAAAQLELSTGKQANIDLTLGHRVETVAFFHRHVSRMTDRIASNNVIAARLDITQAALAAVVDRAETFLQDLIREGGEQSNSTNLIAGSISALADISTKLNTSVDGTFVFSGLNISIPPIPHDLSRDDAPIAREFKNAFELAFGFAPSDAAAAEISPTLMQGFIDGPLREIIEEGGVPVWSHASNDEFTYSLSATEKIRMPVSANSAGIRDVVGSLAIIANLGAEALTGDAKKQVLDAAVARLTTGIAGLNYERFMAGGVAERLSNEDKSMRAQIGITSNFIQEQIGSDPTDVAVRVSNLTQAIEASYSMIVRLQKLTLLDVI